MAKFKVTLGYETICEVEVEARNAKEAGEMAEWDYGTESCSDTYVVDAEIMDGQISMFDDTYIVPIVEVEVERP